MSVDLLAQLTRSGALTGKESGKLFSSLLDLTLFADEDTTAAQGEEKLYRWFSDGLLSALRTSERRSIESALNDQPSATAPPTTPPTSSTRVSASTAPWGPSRLRSGG